jgi:hypothetical protein
MRVTVEINRPGWMTSKRLKRGRPLVLLLALVFVAPVLAADRFTDVPNDNPHHDDINTIARVGITLGCNPPTNDQYCPDAAVRRDQMGSFLARTLRAATPVFLHDERSPGAIDFDASPVVCQTVDHTPTVAEHALVHGWLAANSSVAGLMTFIPTLASSTNGGTSWSQLDGQAPRAGRVAVDEWAYGAGIDRLDLTAGTTYRFGLRAEREAGTVDATESRCEVVVQITYRDAGASSLGTSTSILEEVDGE